MGTERQKVDGLVDEIDLDGAVDITLSEFMSDLSDICIKAKEAGYIPETLRLYRHYDYGSIDIYGFRWETDEEYAERLIRDHISEEARKLVIKEEADACRKSKKAAENLAKNKPREAAEEMEIVRAILMLKEEGYNVS